MGVGILPGAALGVWTSIYVEGFFCHVYLERLYGVMHFAAPPINVPNEGVRT